LVNKWRQPDFHLKRRCNARETPRGDTKRNTQTSCERSVDWQSPTKCEPSGEIDDRREKIEKLVEAGLLVKLSPGRKRLYTPEEALEAAKKQRRECYHRFKARLDAAAAVLAQAEVDG
jgi:hypothetical protein